MAKHFDAHLYVANWRSHRLMLRVPRRLLDEKTAAQYCPGRLVEARKRGELGGKYGEGARYRIGREVVRGLPVYVTVFVPHGAHAVHLNECNRADKPVSLVVRVFVKPPVPRPWCFVVESIADQALPLPEACGAPG
jgi:hypothetical protein